MNTEKFKLGNFSQADGRIFSGLVLSDDRVLDIAMLRMMFGITKGVATALEGLNTVDDLLQNWDRSFPALQEIARFASERELQSIDGISTNATDLSIHSPVRRPAKIVCHAQNYAEHVAEMRKSQFGTETLDLSGDFMGEKAKTWPYAFLKAPSALVGARDDIILADSHPKIDWEAEMAVIIGRTGKRITESNAMEHVAGFSTFNDVSCRDNQWRPDRVTLRSDWFSAKSFDSFAPTGPYLVPRQFVRDHMNLNITLSVNGEQKQNGNTSYLIFSPEEQIAFFSKSMTWEPGDMLATGTPAGTGQGLAQFLKAGDIVETEVEGLGRQRNRCVDQAI